MDCRANLLALTRALVDGVVAEDLPSCDEPATYEVVVQLVEGYGSTVDVCTVHQQLTEMSLPGTRSLRKWPRVA